MSGNASTLQLAPPIPVTVTATTRPAGVKSTSNRGWCYGWREIGVDSHRLWIVVMDDTGEVIDFPQTEIVVDLNWSIGRRGEGAMIDERVRVVDGR